MRDVSTLEKIPRLATNESEADRFPPGLLLLDKILGGSENVCIEGPA